VTLRVHVLIDSLTWGGAETLLADYASAAREAGIEVSVAYLNDRSQTAGRLRELGIDPVRVPIDSLLGRHDRRRVRDHVASVQPDLLHTHLGYADLLGGLAARSLGVPSVSTIHVMEWGGSLREWVKHRLMSLARRYCAARVITVSEAARRRYLEASWDRTDHVVTVHNGIRAGTEPGSGLRVRGELGIGERDIVLAMVTVLRPGKGHDLAALAVNSLRQKYPNLKLLVLGDGPGRAEIERQLEVAGDAVVMAGFRDDVLAVLDGVDILVHPTRIDAFPTALLDALAARVPIVATAVGGIPEIVTDGETGLLLNPPPTAGDLTDALGRLLDNSGLRRQLSERGLQVFDQKFTAERWIERLLPVYETALQTRS
jgi:glycosyltransferase involved in cell wall biosynthesis